MLALVPYQDSLAGDDRAGLGPGDGLLRRRVHAADDGVHRDGGTETRVRAVQVEEGPPRSAVSDCIFDLVFQYRYQAERPPR